MQKEIIPPSIDRNLPIAPGRIDAGPSSTYLVSTALTDERDMAWMEDGSDG